MIEALGGHRIAPHAESNRVEPLYRRLPMAGVRAAPAVSSSRRIKPKRTRVSSMEITRKTGTDGLELVVEGRIDAYWADHLTAALDEALRGGADRISLDLHGVAYLSSGGIRALLVAYRELGRVGRRAAHRAALERGQVDARDGGSARPARPLPHRAQGDRGARRAS